MYVFLGLMLIIEICAIRSFVVNKSVASLVLLLNGYFDFKTKRSPDGARLCKRIFDKTCFGDKMMFKGPTLAGLVPQVGFSEHLWGHTPSPEGGPRTFEIKLNFDVVIVKITLDTAFSK